MLLSPLTLSLFRMDAPTTTSQAPRQLALALALALCCGLLELYALLRARWRA